MTEYKTLMNKVCEFANDMGLEASGLIKDNSDNDTVDRHVISVSSKFQLDDSDILYNFRDTLKSDFDKRLVFPVVGGTEQEILRYKKMAEEKGAEVFTKKSIAFDGFIRPTREFLALSEVEQVEYALHESFHRTKKKYCGRGVDHLSFDEEPRAVIAGHLGAISFFEGTEREQEAKDHYVKHLGLARKVNKYYQELTDTFRFRLGDDGRPLDLIHKLKDKDEVIRRAELDFKDQLGGPVNNAFFIYWNFFYCRVADTAGKVAEIKDIKTAIHQLKTFDIHIE